MCFRYRNVEIMKNHDCCYYQCPQEGVVHVGINGGDSHWICWRHLNRWNQTRARLISDGGGCAMQQLGELLCAACWHEVSKRT